ncbi:heavy metal sensor histidine kinase [Pseudomonas typographi]|uniref:heavy metal sensor histidine kinase n=1 Tax=Pseudomonas typographi TaxID=2715964 RepID=UPI0016875C3F|nr:heavy metal sensor histidine kinase [Pseudomonas typographi]MBD1554240.1 heavy metal sensor histidine kinase [Pseudomonas typographi]
MNISLSGRIGLLFAACTAVVSLLAGVLFNRASEAHFLELDQQLLGSRLQALRTVLGGVNDRASLAAHLPALQSELAHESDLGLRILGPDGQLWFDDRPTLLGSPAPPGLTRLQGISGDFRVLRTPLAGGQGPQLELLLDITHHQHFLQRMQRLIWLTVGLSALATALLGAWAARRALAPLRRMGEVAASVSATSLTTRLPDHALPAELAEVAHTFNAMLGRLDDAFQRLTAFSADIAHELRTPLTNLLTHTQVTLARPRPLEDYREALHGNLEELQRLAQLVNDMLLLAKAEHGLLMPGHEALDLAQEVDALLEYYRLLADESGITLAQHGHANVYADRGMLRRALSNVLENALRFTPAGGQVTVNLQQTAEEVRAEVHNTGPGIAPARLARLFDRFYREAPARPDEHSAQHAGLGLAITRSIVRAHGGGIHAESGQGWVRLVIRLPAHS